MPTGSSGGLLSQLTDLLGIIQGVQGTSGSQDIDQTQEEETEQTRNTTQGRTGTSNTSGTSSQVTSGSNSQQSVAVQDIDTTQVEQTQYTDQALNEMIQMTLRGSGGVQDIGSAARGAGLYNASSEDLLLGNLYATASNQAAIARAPKVTTNKGKNTTTTSTIGQSNQVTSGVNNSQTNTTDNLISNETATGNTSTTGTVNTNTDNDGTGLGSLGAVLGVGGLLGSLFEEGGILNGILGRITGTGNSGVATPNQIAAAGNPNAPGLGGNSLPPAGSTTGGAVAGGATTAAGNAVATGAAADTALGTTTLGSQSAGSLLGMAAIGYLLANEMFGPDKPLNGSATIPREISIAGKEPISVSREWADEYAGGIGGELGDIMRDIFNATGFGIKENVITPQRRAQMAEEFRAFALKDNNNGRGVVSEADINYMIAHLWDIDTFATSSGAGGTGATGPSGSQAKSGNVSLSELLSAPTVNPLLQLQARNGATA